MTKRKDDPKPDSGAQCPHCGEMVRPKDRYRYPIERPEAIPHDSPFECIAFLRRELDDLRDRIACHDHDDDFIR